MFESSGRRGPLRLVAAVVLVLSAVLVAAGAVTPLHAQQPASQNNAAFGIVLDNSGSNRQTDPTSLRFIASQQLVQLLESGDELTAVVFSQDVTKPIPLTKLTQDDQRKSLNDALRKQDPQTDTNMLPAFIEGRGELAKATNRKRILFFMSDGELSPANCDTDCRASQRKQLIEEAAKARTESGITVYSIGLGRELDTDLMQQIADKGGGLYLSAPTAEDLAPLFQRVLERESLTTFDESLKDQIEPGQSRDIDFPVHRFVRTLVLFVTYCDGGKIASVLKKPDGSAVDASKIEPGVYNGYRVTGPVNGRWRLTVTNTGTKACKVGVTSNLRIDVEARITKPPAQVFTGDAVPIEVAVQGRVAGADDARPLAGVYPNATVLVSIEGKGTTKQLTLARAADPAFAGSITFQRGDAGQWTLRVTVNAPSGEGKILELPPRTLEVVEQQVNALTVKLGASAAPARKGVGVQLSAAIAFQRSVTDDVLSKMKVRFAVTRNGVATAEIPGTFVAATKAFTADFTPDRPGTYEVTAAATHPAENTVIRDGPARFEVPEVRVGVQLNKLKSDEVAPKDAVELSATTTLNPVTGGADAAKTSVKFKIAADGKDATLLDGVRAADGSYAATWTPEVEGKYVVSATASSEFAEVPAESEAQALTVVEPGFNAVPWILPVIVAVIAALGLLKLYSMFRVSEFPARATLSSGFDESRRLRRLAGGPRVPYLRLKNQTYTLGLSSFMRLDEGVVRFEATKRGVALTALRDAVTVRGVPLEVGGPPDVVTGSADLHGEQPSRWDVRYQSMGT